jgi:hypothetical protein
VTAGVGAVECGVAACRATPVDRGWLRVGRFAPGAAQRCTLRVEVHDPEHRVWRAFFVEVTPAELRSILTYPENYVMCLRPRPAGASRAASDGDLGLKPWLPPTDE